VRPARAPFLVTAVTLVAAAGGLVIGVFPDLFAHFPRLSTLIGAQ
jgi:hypothetical protein